MAYKKQTWVDFVTPLDAEHMNHIEDGIGSLSEEMVNKLGFDPTKQGLPIMYMWGDTTGEDTQLAEIAATNADGKVTVG